MPTPKPSLGPSLSTNVSHIRASVFADLAADIEEYMRSGGTLLPLHIGDTHLMPPEAARFDRVASKSESSASYRYGAIGALKGLRDACARRAGPRIPWVDPERHILIGAGATHALFCAARAAFDEGDEVLVLSPYWPLSVGILRSVGAVPVEVPLPSGDVDERELLERIMARMSARTRGLYFITPNNPDGRVLSRGVLLVLADLARAFDLWLFADEVYADYAFDRPHLSIASFENMKSRTITAYSFSKSHALAGARVGYVVADERLVAAARRVSTHTVFNVPVLSQQVALAAIESGGSYIEEARRVYIAQRDEVLAWLKTTPLRWEKPMGGSYVFVDFAPILRARSLAAFLKSAIREGVLLAPGDAFGAGFEAHARLCYTAAPLDELRVGLQSLTRAIEQFA